MATSEHFMATDIEWDPTGRYVATSVTSVHEMENDFNIWTFNGKLLYRILKDRLFQRNTHEERRAKEWPSPIEHQHYHHPASIPSSPSPIACLTSTTTRYWVTEMHVDGFRFYLASILTRGSSLWDSVNVYGNPMGGDLLTTGTPLSNPALIDMISNDPVLRGVKLLAEAWDCGPVAFTKLAGFHTGASGLNGMGRYVFAVGSKRVINSAKM